MINLNTSLYKVISSVELPPETVQKSNISGMTDIYDLIGKVIPLSDCPYGLFVVVDESYNENHPIIGFKTAIKDQYGNEGCYDLSTGMPLRFDQLGDKQYEKDAYKNITVMSLKSEVKVDTMLMTPDIKWG